MKRKHICLLICSAFFSLGFFTGNILTDARNCLLEPEKEVITVTQVSTNTIVEKVEVPKVVKFEIIKEVDRIPELELSEADKILIAKIVYAEAGNQDYIGKRLVADVVLNRLDSDKFPNTVKDVVYASGQFASPSGYYTDECMEAVEAECIERLDREILWFKLYGFHKIGAPAYQHGAHYFNK